ncbi:PREDICTED: non-specific lipid-transfer protein 1-like [Erythranthe guttata]|nr:PREDICTED: non-specific lipid-transfer protein 1-like [Erythranthe guttata]|eukprot:XP_012841331.1 PREDICTED: non-specific lipid-transfer protein 1-like [Erythranthe guttata]
MKGVAVVFVVVLAAVSLAASPGEAVSCGELQSSLSPCLSYLQAGGGEPSESCCGGVRSVTGSIQSTQDRQTACNCLKSAASSYNVRTDVAANLPGKCGASIGMTISPNVDCSQYVFPCFI